MKKIDFSLEIIFIILTRKKHFLISYFRQITNFLNNFSSLVVSHLSNPDKKSVKSSDSRSSSGHGSDVELLSSSKSKHSKKPSKSSQKAANTYQSGTNYYDINDLSKNTNNNNKKESTQRSLDKVPSDMRLSKQSFHVAMENPCEFFVDVM